jgi:hypothetical protein
MDTAQTQEGSEPPSQFQTTEIQQPDPRLFWYLLSLSSIVDLIVAIFFGFLLRGGYPKLFSSIFLTIVASFLFFIQSLFASSALIKISYKNTFFELTPTGIRRILGSLMMIRQSEPLPYSQIKDMRIHANFLQKKLGIVTLEILRGEGKNAPIGMRLFGLTPETAQSLGDELLRRAQLSNRRDSVR